MTAPVQPRRPAGRFSVRPTWVVLALLALLTVALTWPIVARLGSRVPGTSTWAFDESTFLWNLWYFKHSLLDLHISPLHSELIWFPLGIDLILYTFNFFNALIALPLQLAFNLPLASNVTLLLATLLSGFGAYLLASYVLGSCEGAAPMAPGPAGRLPPAARRRCLRGAAFLAGVIFAFASNRAVYMALGHYNFATTEWLPFYALYLLRTLRRPGLRDAVLMGLFFALAALAETTLASFLVLFSLVVVAAWWRAPVAGPPGAPQPLPARARRQALGRLTLAGLVAALLWAPVLLPVLREFVGGNYALTGWGESLKLSADLKGLVTPTALNPLFSAGAGGAAAPDPASAARDLGWQAALRAVEEGKGPFSDINTAFLGWVTLALAAAGAWLGRRRLQAWIWSALVFGVLTLGPLLQIDGRYLFDLDQLLPQGVAVPLPFILLHYIPLASANRAANRYSLLLMLALAVLAANAAAWLLARLAARRAGAGRGFVVYFAAGVLALLLVAEHLAVPLPTTDATVPEVYRQIAEQPGDFAVMQLPLGWRDSYGALGAEQTQLQYFQTLHGKPIIGGNISRAPASKMAYFARIPLFRALTDLEAYRDVPPEVDAAARAQAGALMALYDVRYLVTAPAIPGRYPYQDTWQRTEAYALSALPLRPTPLWTGAGYRVYEVVPPPISYPYRVDLGAAGQEPYLGDGWDVRGDEQPYGATAVWATGTTADLYLPLAGPGGAGALRLAVAPLSYGGAPAQSLTILINDVEVLHARPLAPGWQVVAAPLPAAALRPGPSRIRLRFAWAASPRQVLPDAAGRGVIGATGVTCPVNLDVHGFSEAFITATGRDGSQVDASAGRRGYNVAVLDPRSGQVLDRQGFDTAANSYEATRLAAYLASIPRGRIVAVAGKGDAGAYLTAQAVQALRGLGSRAAAPAGLAGQAHALIGVQGAAPGTAAETIAAGDAFVRVAGDFRRLDAAVDWVEVDH